MAIELIHGMLDKRFHETLDQRVGILDNPTPREARLKRQRPQEARRMAQTHREPLRQPNDDDPIATYDFSRIWAELGVEKLRK